MASATTPLSNKFCLRTGLWARVQAGDHFGVGPVCVCVWLDPGILHTFIKCQCGTGVSCSAVCNMQHRKNFMVLFLSHHVWIKTPPTHSFPPSVQHQESVVNTEMNEFEEKSLNLFMFVLVWLIIDSPINFSFCSIFEARETEITWSPIWRTLENDWESEVTVKRSRSAITSHVVSPPRLLSASSALLFPLNTSSLCSSSGSPSSQNTSEPSHARRRHSETSSNRGSHNAPLNDIH